MDIDALMKSLGPVQDALQKAGAERTTTTFTGTSGSGAVAVTLRGDLTISKLVIAPAAMAASQADVSMLEDLLVVACNDALRQYRDRFGASPDEQVQKMLGSSGLGSMVGPLMGMLRKP